MTMRPGSQFAVGLFVLLLAGAVASLWARYGGATLTAPLAVRLALSVCTAAFLVVGLVYFDAGYYGQTLGHTIAGFGFGTVAFGGEGPVAWVGVLLLAIGGAILVSAGRRSGPGAAST